MSVATPRSRGVVALVVGTLLVLAVAGYVYLTRSGPPPPPDRWAVDQVAQRYRALGATLLDGAARCTPATPRPGEVEKADCSFGTWSLELTAYDTPSRLSEVRAQVTAPRPGAVRQDVTDDADGTFLMRQVLGGGELGTSTVYWDATTPRPMSAQVVTPALSLPELVAFWDARGATAIDRPDLPGPAFRSAALWSIAYPFVAFTQVDCSPTPSEQWLDGAVEQVTCRYPAGALARYVRVPDDDALTRTRIAYSSTDVAPGTLRIGVWRDVTDGDGQTIEYVDGSERTPYLYLDRRPALSFIVVSQEGLTQDQLLAFWDEVDEG